jgi:hypothetical protein
MMQGLKGGAVGTYPGQKGVYVSAVDYVLNGVQFRHYFVVFHSGQRGAAHWVRNLVRARARLCGSRTRTLASCS